MTYWWGMDLEEWGMCLEGGLVLFWCCTSLFFHLPGTPAVEKITSTGEGDCFDLSICHVFYSYCLFLFFILILRWISTFGEIVNMLNKEEKKRSVRKWWCTCFMRLNAAACCFSVLMQNHLTECFYICCASSQSLQLPQKVNLGDI